MKLFSVKLSVQIVDCGELKDPEPSLSESMPNDDPTMTGLAKIFDRVASTVQPGTAGLAAYFPGGPQDGVSMSQTVNIAAGSFKELQEILTKFHDVAQSLQVVP